jgi:PHD/YefM family antitoxin component YafN of YafNO toxin-antitoxin module
MLDDMEKTISMAELAKHAERIARDIETAGTVYRIKRVGRPNILVIDELYLERRVAMAELMQVPGWQEHLEQSRRDFEQGRSRPLDDVLEELGFAESRAKQRRSKAARRVASSRSTARGKRAPRASRRPA